ncbi:filament-like plant protein isoform X2 [Spinacia oleracea]|uniref:Filament-like plant protein isoform X2 n=1 Tax=Spinacia oleracea TaxID=3562 RepID=A0A9R0IXP6_SPIOL|nr:filament-like plant protein isoform X2 [Spinacia oleracea]XP_056693881.1 filament-like plant protein isoform X2 [Spinacia oleracea]
MVKRKWLWGKKSSEKTISGETESSGSMSSHSDKLSEDQEPLKESPSNHQSQEVNSKAAETEINREETDEKEQSLTQNLSNASENNRSKDKLSEKDASNIFLNGDTEQLSKGSLSNGNSSSVISVEDTQGVNFAVQVSNGCVKDNDSLKLLTEKLSAALVNVSHKDELVKQHSKVAEEAVAGWEKAENEAATLKQQLEAAVQKKSSMEARVTQLDEALKECVRQLRLARDEQERKINQAVAEKTNELELSKTRLENQLVELQNLLETSRMNSPDLDLRRRVDFLEDENIVIRQELQSLSEELEVMTIERDLSTEAAETASKQHLESIKKLARLEAECRKLKSLSRVSSLSNCNERKSTTTTAAASCAESLTDSQSDGAEQLSISECDSRKMNGSWASALISELDQFKSEKNMNSSSLDINLMDDFLEMERLAALPDSGPQVHSDKIPEKADRSLRIEFEEIICKLEAEKAELGMKLARTQSCFEESQVQLIETQMKFEQLERELNGANEGENFYKALFIQFEREANLMSSQLKSVREELEREQALSEQNSASCKDLENELKKKEEELEIQQQDAMCSDELRLKDMALEKMQNNLEKSKAQLNQAEKKLEEANEEKKSLKSELDSVRLELQTKSSQIESLNEHLQKEILNEHVQKELSEANEEKKSLKSELDSVRLELQTKSTQIESLNEHLQKEILNEQVQKVILNEQVQKELEKKLSEANEEKKSLKSELESVRMELQTKSTQIESLNEHLQKEILNEQVKKELEKELKEANEEKKSLKSEVNSLTVELKRISSQIESLNEDVQKKELEKELKEANEEKKCLNSELDCVREELQMKSSQIELLNEKIELLNEKIQKEQALVAELSSISESMEYELRRKTQELDIQQKAHSNNEMKIKQEDLAIAAGKLADCQETIASLGSQLKSLSTLEDFLIDTASIPRFSPPAPLLDRRNSGGEPWKLHSNDTYLTEKERDPLTNVRDDLSPFAASHGTGRDIRGSPASSSSSTSASPAFFLSYPGSDKNGNGFANFYSVSRS